MSQSHMISDAAAMIGKTQSKQWALLKNFFVQPNSRAGSNTVKRNYIKMNIYQFPLA